MKNNKIKQQEGWINIRLRKTTIKRLRIVKAEKELKLYDDAVNIALDELEEVKNERY